MNIRRILIYAALLSAFAAAIAGCKISYSFSGASIHPDAKTFSVQYFPNNAPMVAPILSPEFTDALKDRFQRQTKLSEVRENGDLAFEGEITGYTSTPSSISGDTEQAVQNRLTITVRVRFANALEPQWNFERSFSAFLDYPSSSMLSDVESSLIPEIVDMLIEDIFNAAVANW
ncbi:MAG: LPS assembly lipoprotein LptE [Rikenellaceae bacterium]|nr:LPS assembly lipoprotein LptE [Rikenellaceae bacterium]